MNIQINSIHIELTDAIRSYIEEKVKKIEKLTKRNADGAYMEFEISMASMSQQSGNLFQSNIHLNLPGYEVMTVRAQNEDVYAAIDEARDEMVREIKRVQGRRESAFLRGARRLKAMVRGNR